MMYCQLYKKYNSTDKFFILNIKAHFKLNAINVLFGNSGAGKTSVLRLLAGLDSIDKGYIKLKNTYWLQTTTGTQLPISKREIAYVFQDYGLFPNMSVLKNLTFVKKNINQNLLNQVISTLEIKQLLQKNTNELSGGQQQRVALARAIIQEPKFLFLDEPLTAIDDILRSKLQLYLIELQKRYHFTVIMVSHNLQEVLKIADHVCIIHHGEVIKQGDSTILLPKNEKNILKGTILNIDDKMLDVLIGTQRVCVKKTKIKSNFLNVGDIVDITI